MSVATLPAAAPTGAPTDVDLSTLVADIAARPHLWEHAVRFDGQERCWTRIDGPEGVDVRVLTWLTFQGTDLHDHGRSSAALTVVRGRLVPRTFVPGVVATIAPQDVHDVRTELAEPAVSIHAYSPRLSEMTYCAWLDGAVRPVRTVLSDQPEEGR